MFEKDRVDRYHLQSYQINCVSQRADMESWLLQCPLEKVT